MGSVKLLVHELLRNNCCGCWTISASATYRPLYEELPSRYSQRVRPKRGVLTSHEESVIWPGVTVTSRYTGKNVTGEAILPFDIDSRGDFSHWFQTVESADVHAVASALRYWRRELSGRVGNTAVVDLQRHVRDQEGKEVGDAYLSHVLCNLLPDFGLDTKSSCRALRSGPGEIGMLEEHAQKNNAYPIDADLLAVAAFERGWVSETRDRVWLIERIQSDIQRYGTIEDVPYICLPDRTLQRIFNATFAAELSVGPQGLKNETMREEARRHHADGFRRAVDRKTFCRINASAALEQTQWRR